MYGPENSSENKQAESVIDRLPKNSIVMADSGFVTINLPAQETWADTIGRLPTQMQQRIRDASFYQTLQTAIINKLLQQIPAVETPQRPSPSGSKSSPPP